MRQLTLGVRLKAQAVFASFATGGNAEVLSALGGPGRDPLWLWGNHGCGKTHLLQAVCAAAGETRPGQLPSVEAGAGQSAAYVPLDDSSALPPDALKGFENCRVLCVDDVDAVAGKLEWEQALFRLFNDAAELHSRIIFASSAAPRQIDWRLDDWRSRAKSCIVYHVRDLDESGRAEALSLRAAQRGLQLPPQTLDYLLRRMPRDLPSLLDILDELDEASMIAQRRLTIPFIRDALERHARIKP
jgi:DnaA family protein